MTVNIGKLSVNIEDILAKVSELEILNYYFGIDNLPISMNNPFRKDVHASFGIYTKNGYNVRWVDFATNESGGIFDLLGKYWRAEFPEVVRRIFTDLPYILKSDSHVKFKTGTTRTLDEYRTDVKMECQIREWEPHDIEYWGSYGISLSWLKFADVYPVSYKIIIADGIRRVYPAERHAYAYVEFKEGVVTLKIYQPFSKSYKWSNKHDRSVISLWTKVPEYGNKICICSSMKDALCLWANTGIPSLAVQGEGYSMSNTAVEELKRRYKSIYILFDNDETGLKDGVVLSESTGFTNLVLPSFEGGKDISDLMKAKGLEEFKNIVLPLFK